MKQHFCTTCQGELIQNLDRRIATWECPACGYHTVFAEDLGMSEEAFAEFIERIKADEPKEPSKWEL